MGIDFKEAVLDEVKCKIILDETKLKIVNLGTISKIFIII